jgi:16S rRNA G527 N7-methylase RsmG
MAATRRFHTRGAVGLVDPARRFRARNAAGFADATRGIGPRCAAERPRARLARVRTRGGLGSTPITPAAIPYEKLIKIEEWSRLLPLIAKLGVDAELVLPRLAQFVGAAKAWNRGVSNLVSQTDESRLVTRHVYESLEPGAWLRLAKAQTWLDFGSGAGFPALPLAICGVGEKWTLVESRRPKTLFLRKAISDLGVGGVSVVHTRLELMIPSDTPGPGTDETVSRQSVDGGGPEHGVSHGLVDGFTSRATMALGPTLRFAAPFVRAGGSAFCGRVAVERKRWQRIHRGSQTGSSMASSASPMASLPSVDLSAEANQESFSAPFHVKQMDCRRLLVAVMVQACRVHQPTIREHGGSPPRAMEWDAS